MKIGLLGKKLGMTRVFDSEGRAQAATVIAVGGNSVVQVKSVETDGYSAIQLGFDEQKPQRMTKSELGHFKKAGVSPKKAAPRNSCPRRSWRFVLHCFHSVTFRNRRQRRCGRQKQGQRFPRDNEEAQRLWTAGRSWLNDAPPNRRDRNAFDSG